jgi:hypothetical protein
VPEVAKRKVAINSKPWSFFTVDGDPTRYQAPSTIALAPGPHKIHFTGNDYAKVDKTITLVVPEGEGAFTHFEALTDPPAPKP